MYVLLIYLYILLLLLYSVNLAFFQIRLIPIANCEEWTVSYYSDTCHVM